MEENKIMVIYSKVDASTVLPLICKMEESLNTKFWIEREGVEDYSMPYSDLIKNAVEECDIILFMLSENSLRDGSARMKAVYGIEMGKRILPIVLDGEGPRGWLLRELYVHANDKEELNAICDDLKRWLEPLQSYNGHEYVDLGLSVKWATCNIGAHIPQESGSHIAWGEFGPRPSLFKADYVTWLERYGDSAAEHCYNAAVLWGDRWRLPTKVEMEELSKECNWKFVVRHGLGGYKITGKNGNYIFLPLTGYYSECSFHEVGKVGCYWTSTPADRTYMWAYNIIFGDTSCSIDRFPCYMGCFIRPVIE